LHQPEVSELKQSTSVPVSSELRKIFDKEDLDKAFENYKL